MAEFNAANFARSIASDAASAATSAAVDAVTSAVAGAGPLGQITAQFLFDTVISDRTITRAIISSDISTRNDSDWRVAISIPEVLLVGDILGPLKESTGTSSAFNTGNRMVFPFNPSVLFSHTANYAQVQPTHTNYAYNAYESSQVDAITITGEFFQENENDAKYWIACLHFLRTATKMFYGESDPLGNPPPVCRLNGYGDHVLNNIPVVVTNFTTDLPQDSDYIECTVNGIKNFVPVQSTITVTLQPQYARRSQARFSLNQYAAGGHVQGDEGFI